ncbi:MAG: hypothetical protein O3C19_06400, partial [Bacteroidetes bacterium]|nr:hypothetical protein [Bacteroidota bacterium]
KLFKLKEDISVFTDESQATLNYRIKADRWIDFSAAYSITNQEGAELGKVARKGWRSIWKAEYFLIDQNERPQYKIQEENGGIKVLDGLLSEIPILGLLTGYFFNPSYIVTNNDLQPVARLKKEASFWGRKFEITKLAETVHEDDERMLLGLMMMVLLERRRG